ncbi:hypothetical protein L6452_04984 [Arctium lappa]|uniref:Uncharacterized protein n=1 Tax=Arctium lappa TaxID=4217 RepID=A0ACB9EF54_ARCLA|nr:hypothetical protein L6452_04984 [Arctium lappa]
MVASAALVALKTLLSVLACVMCAMFVWGFVMDGWSSCFDIHARWMVAALIDFYIHVAIIGAWVVYKESSRIRAAVLILFLITLGSITTCTYIVVLLFKLSPEESSKDPLYFVLARHQKRDVSGHRRGPSVVTARIIFSALGCLMLGTFIYTLIVDGSPFRAQVFTPCMIGATTDFYFNVVVLSVWVAYKESSWISAFLWILSIVCFGSITTCVYMLRQLFYLSPDQPVSLIIFNSSNRDLQLSDPLLMANAYV